MKKTEKSKFDLHFNVNNYHSNNTDMSKLFISKIFKQVHRSLIGTLTVLLVLIVLTFTTNLFISKYGTDIKFLEDINQFDKEIKVSQKLNAETRITDYFDSGNYKSVVDICEQNTSKLSPEEKLLFAHSYEKINEFENAILWYEIIAKDTTFVYREQAEYRLAYVLFSRGNKRCLEVLNKIISNTNHSYHEIALQFYNHPVMKRHKKHTGEMSLLDKLLF